MLAAESRAREGLGLPSWGSVGTGVGLAEGAPLAPVSSSDWALQPGPWGLNEDCGAQKGTVGPG